MRFLYIQDVAPYEKFDALVDPCWGEKTLDLNKVKENNEPFALMNEPSPGMVANCEILSHFNTKERNLDHRLALWVISGIPILPNQEMLLHYGESYARSYPVGDPCPMIFNMKINVDVY